MPIVIPAAVMGVLGLVFGVGLAFLSRVLAVKEDERIGRIREALPGANCGGCGYPGCDGFARAVAAGEAEPSGCPVGGAATAAAVADIMGVAAGEMVEQVAMVACRGNEDHCAARFDYAGIEDCRAASNVLGGFKACPHACLGLGSCAQVCPFGAIEIRDHFVHIDRDKCTACGACVRICPKSVIMLHPKDEAVAVRCHSALRGKVVMDNCTAGCIGCGKCARTCKFKAIKMVDNLPVFDMQACVGCQQCAKDCPTGAIARMRPQRAAFIDYSKCTNCGKCKAGCQFEAFSTDETIELYPNACTGCGQCVSLCPEQCIELREWSPKV